MYFQLEVSIPVNNIKGALTDAIQSYLLPAVKFTILKKSLDARRKSQLRFVLSLKLNLTRDEKKRLQQKYPALRLRSCPEEKPQAIGHPPHTTAGISRSPVCIVGSGPAGLFCALRLLKHGVTSTLLEQGEQVDIRSKKVRDFWTNGLLDLRTNVQFGEGGAGTFSDGKLNTSKNNINIKYVLEQFQRYGAPAEILYEAKPHIGTNNLQKVVHKLREYLLAQGCTIRFNNEVTDLRIVNGLVKELVSNEQETLSIGTLVLAIGNSSRKLFRLLHKKGVALQAKNFAVGFRVEHPQELIDEIQYGTKKRHPLLPPADYKLTFNKDGLGVYSFCMCPGGQVIAASSEKDRLVINGMSVFERNSGYANSALVVSVTQATVDGINAPDNLKGLVFQEMLEERTFAMGGGNYFAPVERLTSFLDGQNTGGPITCSYRPGTTVNELSTLLPEKMSALLKEAIRYFDTKMPGFITQEAVLLGTETRTSSPLTILRTEKGTSLNIANMYPCGEGAGYAGGIMSAALDGIATAEKLLQHNP
jgi:uncharacterized FAD-dependent dehydrogenase